MSNIDKSSLRAEFKKRRKDISDRVEKEIRISQKLIASDLFKSSETVFLYSSSGTEVSTDMIFEAALKQKKKIAFPYCTDTNGNMSFYFADSSDALKEDMYGIKAPIPEECKNAESDSKSLCIVPGLCFDRNGGRLGYGKGYYDKFLADFKGISVGISFEECVTEKLILDKFDKRMNYLITQNKIYVFNQKEE